jgi:hypothetical protein
MRHAIFLVSAFFLLLLSNTAYAETYAPGTITEDTTWTKEDSPYIVDTLTIPEGITLTVAPGAVIKLGQPGCNCYVNIFVAGRMVVGALNDPLRAVITSINDDIGGDTNGDGAATTPNPGDWRQIQVGDGGLLELYNTDVRYGGLAVAPHIYFNPDNVRQINNSGGTVIMDHADISFGHITNYRGSGTTIIRNSHIHDTSTGLVLSGGNATIENNTFSAVGTAIEYPWGMQLLHRNNHGVGGITQIGALSHDVTLTPDTLPYTGGWITVPAGVTLRLLPGVVMKNTGIFVSGILESGTPTSTEEVVITSSRDDTAGGDTNGDGNASGPVAGDWGTIHVSSGGVGNFFHTTLHYGGAYTCDYWGKICSIPMLENNGDLTLVDTTITDAKAQLLVSSGVTTISTSEFARGTHGVYIRNGTAVIHGSSIYDSTEYGVFNATQNTIDATNNWWGSATGPRHASNPQGTGDRISDRVNFGGWLTAEPLETSLPDLCTENCNSNVLFLPGLQASRLYRHYPNCLNNCERMLWTPDGGPYFEDLFLTASGTSAWGDIYTRDVLDEAVGFNVYKSFLSDLEDWKNNERSFNDYAAIPYDWRLSLDALIGGGYKNADGTLSYLKATSTPYIIQELERLAADSRTGKVTIIAHSNGGLVAKALMIRLEELGKADLVDNIVLVASPQTGTPQALGAILHGYNQALPTEWFPLMITKAQARTMAQNMPGAYHLLPSEQYFRDVQTPVASFANSSPLLSDAYAQYGSLLNSWTEMSGSYNQKRTSNGTLFL